MEWSVTNQNGTSELRHYGVKGMKWGVRRTPEELGHKPSASKKPKWNKKSIRFKLTKEKVSTFLFRRLKIPKYRRSSTMVLNVWSHL